MTEHIDFLFRNGNRPAILLEQFEEIWNIPHLGQDSRCYVATNQNIAWKQNLCFLFPDPILPLPDDPFGQKNLRFTSETIFQAKFHFILIAGFHENRVPCHHWCLSRSIYS